MMISPESYYEMWLRGKSIPQIQKQIDELRQEMHRGRKKLEKPNYMATIFPSEDVVLSVDRDYLAMAKKALIEAGGNYIETEPERKDRAFNEKLSSLKKLDFNLHVGANRFETATYKITDGKVMIKRSAVGIDLFDSGDYGDEYESNLTPEEFIEELKDVHLGEWKEKYNQTDTMVLDGGSWDLSLTFEGEEKPTKFSGENKVFAFSFDKLMEVLEIQCCDYR